MKDEWVKLAETCAERDIQVNIASILESDNKNSIFVADVKDYPTIRLYEGPVFFFESDFKTKNKSNEKFNTSNAD